MVFIFILLLITVVYFLFIKKGTGGRTFYKHGNELRKHNTGQGRMLSMYEHFVDYFKDGKKMGSEIFEEIYNRIKGKIENNPGREKTGGLSSGNDKSSSNKLLELGIEKLNEGELEAGIKYLSQAIDADSTNWSAYYERGHARSLYLLGDISDAKKKELLKSINKDLRKSVELQLGSSINPLPRMSLSRYENELNNLEPLKKLK